MKGVSLIFCLLFCGMLSCVRQPVVTEKANDGMLRVAWRLQTQQNVYGFNVYRGEAENGPWVIANKDMIPGDDTLSIPKVYEFFDSGLTIGKKYYYYVEEITFDGSTSRITPVMPGIAKPRKYYKK